MLARVYTCQNATLLEISCTGSLIWNETDDVLEKFKHILKAVGLQEH